jgi:hypothetical protein
MNLLFLAPVIQEQLLSMTPVDGGRTHIIVRDLQPVTHEPNRAKRRTFWRDRFSRDRLVSR